MPGMAAPSPSNVQQPLSQSFHLARCARREHVSVESTDCLTEILRWQFLQQRRATLVLAIEEGQLAKKKAATQTK